MRLELIIPDDALTSMRRNKFVWLAKHPEFIDGIVLESQNLDGSFVATKDVPPLSEEELRQLSSFEGTFKLFSDATDEQIDRMEETIRQLKQEDFPVRG